MLLSTGTYGEVTTVPGVRGSHHVLGVEHLLRELRNGNGTVLLASASGERREAGHEEVETGERNWKEKTSTKVTRTPK